MHLAASVGENPETGRGPGVTRDISQAGSYIYLEMDKDLVEGSEVELILELTPEMTLAEPVKIFCQAKVIRIDRSEGRMMGVALEILAYDFRRECA